MSDRIHRKTLKLERLVKHAKGENSSVKDNDIVQAVGEALELEKRARMHGYNDASFSKLNAAVAAAMGALVQHTVEELKRDTARMTSDASSQNSRKMVDGIKLVFVAIAESQKLGIADAGGHRAFSQIGNSMEVLLVSKLDALRSAMTGSSVPDAKIMDAIREVLNVRTQLLKLGLGAGDNRAIMAAAKAGDLLITRKGGRLRSLLDQVDKGSVPQSDDKLTEAAEDFLQMEDNLKKLQIPISADDRLLANKAGALLIKQRLDPLRAATKSLGLEQK